ncbi:MAG: hypothetical protein K2Q28_07480 [Hyphomicrobium sp.]|nr:hypothetical protein [Hyphomicrobium sp.]
MNRAIEKIESRLKAGDDMLSSLRTQLASAHVLRGAIAASTRRTSLQEANSHAALMAFRSALQVPGHEQNSKAKEYEAHQLRLMGHFGQALIAYKELERIASGEGDYRSQRLIQARAKRFQAESIVAPTRHVGSDGRTTFTVPMAAWNLVRRGSGASAQDIRLNFAPYQDWDLIEQGDLHYLTAFFANTNSFVVIERQELTNAEVCYEIALRQPLPRQWRRRERSKLRRAANEGLALVKAAKKGDYQNHWLVQRS